MSAEEKPVHASHPIVLDDLPQPRLSDWLRDMMLIRRFEEVSDELSLRGRGLGGIHAAIGQEAVAVGTVRALRPTDVVTGTHRSHHHALAKGLPPDRVMAELWGRATGSNSGRGGSMHLADFDRGMWGTNGIVGAGLGIALGGALGAQVKGTDQVAVGFFGDGGANVGRVWEFINLAAVWRLPLIAICENNLYAVETASQDVTAGGSIVQRAMGFGLPALSVDGQDVAAVYRAVGYAAGQARAGGGPTFLEMRTYRYRGHSTGQVIRYRTDDEVTQWRERRDPIDRFTEALLAAGLLTDDGLRELRASCERAVDEAVRFAEESPWPDLSNDDESVSAWQPVRP
jgi:pyruvate dehydrogenase E1 component alpha subunit